MSAATGRPDGPATRDLGRDTTKVSPGQFYANHDEWVSANIEAAASAEHFETALSDARAEGNRSRTHGARLSPGG